MVCDDVFIPPPLLSPWGGGFQSAWCSQTFFEFGITFWRDPGTNGDICTSLVGGLGAFHDWCCGHRASLAIGLATRDHPSIGLPLGCFSFLAPAVGRCGVAASSPLGRFTFEGQGWSTYSVRGARLPCGGQGECFIFPELMG